MNHFALTLGLIFGFWGLDSYVKDDNSMGLFVAWFFGTIFFAWGLTG